MSKKYLYYFSEGNEAFGGDKVTMKNTLGGKTVRVDQVNTVDLDEVFAREAALRAAIEKQNKEEGYDLFLLMVTNILDSDTRLLVVGEPQEVVEKAFGKKLFL